MYIQQRFYCSRCLRELEAEGVCPLCGYDEQQAPYDPQVLEDGALLCSRRYRIGAVIGRGGFGVTYAAWDRTLLMPVAIKEFFPARYVRRDAQASYEVDVPEEHRMLFSVGLNNFIREAHILAALENIKNVVAVSNCFEQYGTGYIVMEYVRGVTLYEYVRAHRPSCAALLAMLREPIDALALIHQQGVMHRDLTPNNFMVLEDGTVKLIDFGAAFVDEQRLGGKNLSLGATAHYAAPEQYDPGMEQGQWTDVYGLCATLYALLTDTQPPHGRDRLARDTLVPPRKTGASLNKRQEQALLRGLAPDPRSRLRSIDELRALLYNLPTPEIVRQRRRLARRMAALTAVLAALASLLALNFSVGLPMGDGLLASLRPGGWRIVGQTRPRAERTLPGSLLLLPVTQIGAGAFAGDAALERVVVPGSVAEVSSLAFRGCASLHTAVLEPGVARVGAYAFADCPSLHTLHLPASLMAADASALSGASPFLTAWIDGSEAQRALCASLGVPCAVRSAYEIRADGEAATLTACRDASAAVHFPSYIDGLRVTAIDEDAAPAMLDYGVTSAVLPYYLTRVPDELFDRVYTLESAVLGPHVAAIGSRAFRYTALEQVDLPDSLVSVGAEAFRGVPLSGVSLPDSLQEIGDQAFLSSGLEQVAVPAGVRVLGEDAFGSCGALRSASLGCALDVLGDAFSFNAHLQSVSLPEGLLAIDSLALSNCTALEYLRLPDTLTAIGHSAFSGCVSLRYVLIPPSVTQIHARAFIGCRADLIIAGEPDTAAHRFAQAYGYRFEDTTAYADGLIDGGVLNASGLSGAVLCPALDPQTGEPVRVVDKLYASAPFSVRLPACAEEIAPLAFSHSAVRRVDLPDSLRQIGSMAFMDCGQLEEIALPEGLLSIGSSAFEGCTQLGGIDLPASLRRIGQGAFSGCASLTRAQIPASVTELGSRVFAATGVTQAVIPGSVPYCSDAFRDCLRLRSASVGEGVRWMGETFAGCAALETLSLPASLSSISLDDYAGCASLAHVYIHGMNTTIFCEDVSFSLDWPARALSDGERASLGHPFRDAPGVTIHAHPGSSAERYALSFGLRFEPLAPGE